MNESILDNVKRMVGVDPSLTVFDLQIITHINSVFSRLYTLGVGPESGFMIEDQGPEWDTFLLGDKRQNMIKSYMYLSVRILFDPPQTGPLMNAMQAQIEKMEWLINVTREGDSWRDPSLPAIP